MCVCACMCLCIHVCVHAFFSEIICGEVTLYLCKDYCEITEVLFLCVLVCLLHLIFAGMCCMCVCMRACTCVSVFVGMHDSVFVCVR